MKENGRMTKEKILINMRVLLQPSYNSKGEDEWEVVTYEKDTGKRVVTYHPTLQEATIEFYTLMHH